MIVLKWTFYNWNIFVKVIRKVLERLQVRRNKTWLLEY